jgi:hypothetical protein
MEDTEISGRAIFLSKPFRGTSEKSQVNRRQGAMHGLQGFILCLPVADGAQEFRNTAGARYGSIGARRANQLVDS